MILPSDEEDLPQDMQIPLPLRSGYETLGPFDLRDAKRILGRLDEEHIPFEVDARDQIRPLLTRYSRQSWLFIYIRPEHSQKAEAIVLEDFKV
jgi:hypothetical protein